MLRRHFIALTAIAPLLGASPAFASTDVDILKKAETYLNGVKTLKARFLQVNPDGQSVEGDLFISRPGRMRLVYDPPTPMLLVADGVFLIHVDTEMKDASHIDLKDTPAGILLKENLSFADPTVKVNGVKQGAGTVEITVSMAKDPTAGKMTMVFAEGPFELRQWRVLDAQNKEVTVTLYDAKLGVPLDKDLFRYETRRNRERD